MRTLIALMGCAFLTVSAYAADKQQSTVDKTTVAVVTLKQAQARPAAALTSKQAKADEGDSRLNGYRLEREGCCGPMR
jgi:uncharacterized OsmC-like protein